MILYSELRAGETEVLSSEDGTASELLLNTENLVVLSEAVGTARRSRLDLTSAKSNDEVTNKVVFSLTRAMADHNAPAGGLTHVGGLNRLGDSADLVDLQEQSVAKLLVNTSLDTGRVGNQKVVTNNLDTLVKLLGHFDVRCKVILVEGIFDRDNRVFG